jgi:intron-binding protein aquarius
VLSRRHDIRTKGRAGTKRNIRIRLDCAQYALDIQNGKNIYDSFNLLVRVDSAESNFKGILETIRDLMNDPAAVRNFPPWLVEVFIGYGDAASANYR